MRAARALRTAVAAHAAALEISRLPLHGPDPAKQQSSASPSRWPDLLDATFHRDASQAGQQLCLVPSSAAQQMPLSALAVPLSSPLVEKEDRPAPAAVARASLLGAALHL
jgi:hypothetical protein